MPDFVATRTITDFPRSAWNDCFQGALEGYDHYLAIERAGLVEFDWQYLALMQNNKILVAAAGFITRYSLSTTTTGFLKKLLQGIARLAPALVSLKLFCIGSPITEHGQIGFAPELNKDQRQELGLTFIAQLKDFARSQKIGLTALKDIPSHSKTLWDRAAVGFTGVAALPTAILDLSAFDSFNEYLATLSHATRKDMRRKLKRRELLRIEWRDTIDGLENEIGALYRATKARAELEFEELTIDYFAQCLTRMPEQARAVLYYNDTRLVGFNLVFIGCERMMDKFFCMDVEGRNLNLYFISWMENIRYCLEHDIPCYQSGQASYETKLRLGSQLAPNLIYFRHANPILNFILRRLAPLLAFKAQHDA